MEKKELRKKIEEIDVKRKVKEIRGDTPDCDQNHRPAATGRSINNSAGAPVTSFITYPLRSLPPVGRP